MTIKKSLWFQSWQALIFMNNVKQLHLHDFHLEHSAKFTNFAGWEMPVSYGSSVNEHTRVRSQLGLFDVSHMGEIIIKGPEALEFLNYVLTNNLDKVSNNQAIYSLMCNEDGGVIDDLIVYRISSDEFFLCVNASNVENDFLHLDKFRKPFDCSVLNVSNDYGLIAVQGPEAIDFLEEILNQKFSDIDRMHFTEMSFFGHRSLVARTGYTGEDGFELFLPTNILINIARLLSSPFTQLEHAWVGLAARDSLRLEAGFCLHGHEISEKITPIEAGLIWAVSLDKGDFIGKVALEKQKNSQNYGKVLNYEVNDRRIPREKSTIYIGENEAGKVLSGGYSPLIKKPIGTLYLEKEFLDYRSSKECFADVRGNLVPINFSKPVLRK